MYIKADLSTVNILDLLLQLYFKRATAVLVAAEFAEGHKAQIVVEDGEWAAATAGDAKGPEAIRRVVKWRRGFVMVMEPEESERKKVKEGERFLLIETLISIRQTVKAPQVAATKEKPRLKNALLTSFIGNRIDDTFEDETEAERTAAMVSLLSSEITGLVEALGLEEFDSFRVRGSESGFITTVHDRGYAFVGVEPSVRDTSGAEKELSEWN